MSAPKFRLDNLVAILDYNGHQSGGAVNDIMPLEPLDDKWRAFGWDVWVVNGHDLSALVEAFHRTPRRAGAPTFVLAKL